MKHVFSTKEFTSGLVINFLVYLLDGTYIGSYPAIELGNLGVYQADINIEPVLDYIIGVVEPTTLNWRVVKYIGKKYMNTYVASGIESVPGANKTHFNFFNAIGTGKKIYIDKINLSAVIDALTTGHQLSFYLQKTSSVGTGTNDSISKLNSIIPSLPVGITINKNFTTAPTLVSGTILGAGNLDTEETRSGMGIQTLFKREDSISPIILNEGEGLALVQDSYASNGRINMMIYFNIGE